MPSNNKDQPDLPELKRARALWIANRFDDAVNLFVETADRHPQNVAALVDTARALGHRHEIKRAGEYLDRLCVIAADRSDLSFILGQTFRMIHREELAIECFEKYVAGPGRRHADAHFELAVLYERRHRVADAEAALARVLKLNAAYYEATLLQARLLRRRGELSQAKALYRRLAVNSQVHIISRAQAWAALADIADKEGDYEQAVDLMARCKNIQIAHAEVFQRHSEMVLGNLRRFNESVTAEDLRRWRAQQNDLGPPTRVAHLTSFPRSGTTLLENVLDAHSGVVSSEEREVFSRDILDSSWKESHENTPPTVEAFNRIPVAKLQSLRRRYLDAMEEALNEPIGDRVHIDKNPTHTMFIPAIVRLFPESKFLIALRDPRDVIVSCYFQYLPLNPASVSFLTWESTTHRYALDMGIWLRIRELLDATSWLEVRYEDVVQDMPGSARRALAFLNLSWEEGVLEYRDRLVTKTVHSPTYIDVAQPIHRRPIGRWKNYARWLEPGLGTLDRFVKDFGYA
ncbi:MAG: sulfotransferase [Verrucomicrobiota bacterium]